MQKLEQPKKGYKLAKSFFGKYEEIPEKWNLLTIGKIVKKEKNSVKRGPWGSSLKKEFFVKNGYKVYEQQHAIYNDFSLGSYFIDGKKFSELSDFAVEPGDFIISCSGTIGKISLIPSEAKKGIINQALLKLSVDQNIMNLQYFLYVFQTDSIQKLFTGLTHGSAMKNVVSVKELKGIPIKTPPLSEQQKIASILSNIDSLIQQTQKEIERTQILKKGLMQRLLTKGIEHTKFKKVKSFFGKYEEIPEEWERVKLIQKCSKKPEYGAVVSAIEKDPKLPRYIRITDLNEDGSLRDEEWKSISEKEAKNYLLNEGDFLFARTGATVGKTYLYEKKDGLCAFAGYMIRFIPKSAQLDSKFLFHYTHSDLYWKWLKSIQTWGVQPNVNAEQYSNMLIVLPPLKEQQKIASILSNVDSQIRKQQEYKFKLETLKKGLMQKLLTGQIRVKV